MIVLISPTKTMQCYEMNQKRTLPRFLEESKQVCSLLKEMSCEELCKLMKMNEKLGKENQLRFQNMKSDENGMPAIYAYHGIQYQSMCLEEKTEEEMRYLNQHVRILSGMYGLLKPFDSIYPYRLEMMTKISVGTAKDLYDYWSIKLIEELRSYPQNPVFINLASKEYAKTVRGTKTFPGIEMVDCIFKVKKKGILKVESTASKQARGKMIAYIAKNQIQDPVALKQFQEDGYSYCEELSSPLEWVFVIDKD